ncbi:hypothetical protein SK128_028049 [Halocaridina rubra]|uniref:Odorant receptor n=1 Tax=Halocaridina rubra TaxID=373956 RepID=A0AAN8WQG2_HALRR
MLMRLWVAIVKFLGGLPYSVKFDCNIKPLQVILVNTVDKTILSSKDDEIHNEYLYSSKDKIAEHTPSNTLCFQSLKNLSRPGMLWHRCIALFYLAYFGCIIYIYVTDKYIRNILDSKTRYLCEGIVEVEELTSNVLLCFHLITKHERLAAYLDHLKSLTPVQFANDVLSVKDVLFDRLFTGLNLSAFSGLIATLPLLFGDYGDVFSHASFANYITSLILSYTFIMGFYLSQTILAFLINGLDNLTSRGNCVIHGRSPRGKTNNHLYESMSSWISDSHSVDRTPCVCMDVQSTKMISRKIQNLQVLQKLMADYFSTPVVIILIKTIMLIILSVYGSVTEEYVAPLYTSVLMLLQESMKLLAICCAPEHALSELTYLLDLVEGFPPCSIGGFFIAAKARLIDVSKTNK